MSTMTYKGYAARIEYRDEDACFIGHIAGITHVVGFHADNVAELRAAFEEAVVDYLATCAQLGRAAKNRQWPVDVACAAGSAYRSVSGSSGERAELESMGYPSIAACG